MAVNFLIIALIKIISWAYKLYLDTISTLNVNISTLNFANWILKQSQDDQQVHRNLDLMRKLIVIQIILNFPQIIVHKHFNEITNTPWLYDFFTRHNYLYQIYQNEQKIRQLPSQHIDWWDVAVDIIQTTLAPWMSYLPIWKRKSPQDLFREWIQQIAVLWHQSNDDILRFADKVYNQTIARSEYLKPLSITSELASELNPIEPFAWIYIKSSILQYHIVQYLLNKNLFFALPKPYIPGMKAHLYFDNTKIDTQSLDYFGKTHFQVPYNTVLSYKPEEISIRIDDLKCTNTIGLKDHPTFTFDWKDLGLCITWTGQSYIPGEANNITYGSYGPYWRYIIWVSGEDPGPPPRTTYQVQLIHLTSYGWEQYYINTLLVTRDIETFKAECGEDGESPTRWDQTDIYIYDQKLEKPPLNPNIPLVYSLTYNKILQQITDQQYSNKW